MSTGLFTLLMVNGRVKTLTAAKPSLFAALIKTSAVDQGDAQCSIVTTSIGNAQCGIVTTSIGNAQCSIVTTSIGNAQCSIVTTSIDLLLLKLKWCPHSRKLLVVIVFNPFLRDVS